jgi:hypothetical protein
MLSTSLSGAAERIAGKGLTGGPALIGEAGKAGDLPRERTEEPHRIGAANRNRSAASGTSGGSLWPNDSQKQNRETLKAEQPGSAFFYSI